MMRTRAGFTLVEILLVLALLVVLAGLVMPALDAPLASQRLLGAADQVRTAWTRARVRAMQEGEAHVFTFDAEAGTFRVDSEAGSGIAAAEGINATAAEGFSGTLPLDVIFDSQALAETGIAGAAPAIMFYPDGTTSTAEIRLRNEGGRAVAVRLRGLTGVSTVGEIGSIEELGP